MISTTNNMTSLAPTQNLPESFAFANDTVPLRPESGPLTPRTEVQLHMLAIELVRYAPDLASVLYQGGMGKLSSTLQEA